MLHFFNLHNTYSCEHKTFDERNALAYTRNTAITTKATYLGKCMIKGTAEIYYKYLMLLLKQKANTVVAEWTCYSVYPIDVGLIKIIDIFPLTSTPVYWVFWPRRCPNKYAGIILRRYFSLLVYRNLNLNLKSRTF